VSYLYTQRLDLAVDIFFAFLSTVLLLGAILSLYYIEQSSRRIAIIVMFTLVFALCAVFAACAAYAAILVVFVSGNWTPVVTQIQ
jgi:hypothetical protein